MKKIVSFVLCGIFVAIGLGIAGASDTPPKNSLFDCGRDKVVLLSKKGHYAIGWTIRGTKKDAKPVDWSLSEGELVQRYVYNFDNVPDLVPYELINCAVDLHQKQILELPSDDPYFPNKRRGTFEVFWSSDVSRNHYCLVQNQSRFATDNLWLVRFDKSGITERDLVTPLGKVVRKILREKMPILADVYAISYPGSDWDDAPECPVFHSSSVDIPFTANLPKSSFDHVGGVITVNIPEGTVGKVACDTPLDDPFQDDARLAKADRELNAIYSALQKQLDVSARTALKKEQLEWISQRNALVKDHHPVVGQEIDDSEYRHDRNQLILKATNERSAELQKRLRP